MNSFLKANKLTLNASKTHYIVFHRSIRNLSSVDSELMIDGVRIDTVSATKFLGVVESPSPW